MFLMFRSKFYVQDLSGELSSLAMNVAMLELEVRLLEAEFAYLTTSSRIEGLMSRHLRMEHITPGAIVDATVLYAED
ncbi:hypothetical protein NHE_0876 [Neorickettsia helminthoeca str. Oregon]|uniref:Cell division protein FtsL n=2 Tax=Neorickettsia helminthoeca TaxID=33994 RepID=X5HMS6_9RICK|nr:hypothetical protein NHE_0876 [Neorickettsia helminthoeca str. Oregon]